MLLLIKRADIHESFMEGRKKNPFLWAIQSRCIHRNWSRSAEAPSDDAKGLDWRSLAIKRAHITSVTIEIHSGISVGVCYLPGVPAHAKKEAEERWWIWAQVQ